MPRLKSPGFQATTTKGVRRRMVRVELLFGFESRRGPTRASVPAAEASNRSGSPRNTRAPREYTQHECVTPRRALVGLLPFPLRREAPGHQRFSKSGHLRWTPGCDPRAAEGP